MRRATTFLAGLAAGIGLMYLADPQSGGRRRARLRDQAVSLGHGSKRVVERRGRDLGNRLRGTAAGVRHVLRRDHPDDTVLVERVRSRMGRHTSHPGAVEVQVDGGNVTLRGPILLDEAPGLVRAVERVRGVREVVDHLEPHAPEDEHPALRGGPRPGATSRSQGLRRGAGVLAGVAGVAAGAYGARALRQRIALRRELRDRWA